MSLVRAPSPHLVGARSTTRVMLDVALALVPGLVVLCTLYGAGPLLQVLLCLLFALALEAAVLRLRGVALRGPLTDGSAVVTAALIGVALPALAPWWISAVAVVMAIGIAKHLYGGLGYNPFNPAMIGYVSVLIAFPLEMSTWALPLGAGGPVDLPTTLAAIFGSPDRATIDAVSGATVLDAFKFRDGLTVAEFFASAPSAGSWGGRGVEWVNLAFLAGGAYLLARRVTTWHAPAGLLLGLAVPALLLHDGGSSASLGSPLFHLLSGATMLGAFFIVTDPVSSPSSSRGRLLGGALAGLLVFVIRAWGNYPDAVAFAVLLANIAAPLVDQYVRPRAYGHAPKGHARERRP